MGRVKTLYKKDNLKSEWYQNWKYTLKDFFYFMYQINWLSQLKSFCLPVNFVSFQETVCSGWRKLWYYQPKQSSAILWFNNHISTA